MLAAKQLCLLTQVSLALRQPTTNSDHDISLIQKEGTGTAVAFTTAMNSESESYEELGKQIFRNLALLQSRLSHSLSFSASSSSSSKVAGVTDATLPEPLVAATHLANATTHQKQDITDKTVVAAANAKKAVAAAVARADKVAGEQLAGAAEVIHSFANGMQHEADQIAQRHAKQLTHYHVGYWLLFVVVAAATIWVDVLGFKSSSRYASFQVTSIDNNNLYYLDFSFVVSK